ncbi:hypothetical protein D3C71_772270 [compost metagenome]
MLAVEVRIRLAREGCGVVIHEARDRLGRQHLPVAQALRALMREYVATQPDRPWFNLPSIDLVPVHYAAHGILHPVPVLEQDACVAHVEGDALL